MRSISRGSQSAAFHAKQRLSGRLAPILSRISSVKERVSDRGLLAWGPFSPITRRLAPYGREIVATFRIAIDGEWEDEEFESFTDAALWGREVSLAGHLVWVVEQRRFSSRLLAAFPADRIDEAIELWDAASQEQS
jgi:hypothetical protein